MHALCATTMAYHAGLRLLETKNYITKKLQRPILVSTKT
jgi:hypothetical protein